MYRESFGGSPWTGFVPRAPARGRLALRMKDLRQRAKLRAYMRAREVPLCRLRVDSPDDFEAS